METNIQNDSVDVEIRIAEGKQATLDNIIINGNDLTNEKVVRRQIFTRPGYLFSQTDFERSIREIASLGQFDAEAIMNPDTGFSIVPKPGNSTVDIVYNVTEKPSSQLELSGGWGGRTFVATVGVSFNNFSTHRMFDKGHGGLFLWEMPRTCRSDSRRTVPITPLFPQASRSLGCLERSLHP